MPLFGALDVEAALATAPTMQSLSPDTWELPGVTVLQVSFEVDEAPALAITPPALHPSIPPYATFSFVRCPDSPVGPFTLGMVRLIVRAGIRPRGLLVNAFTDSGAAADALRDGWGYRIATADVQVSRRHDRIAGSISIDGSIAVAAHLDDPEPVSGTDLELFDNLHLTNLAGDDPVIVQVDPGYVYSNADRGAPELVGYDSVALGTEGVVPVYPLVAVACDADMELTAPRFAMDPTTPAIQGTRRLQAT